MKEPKELLAFKLRADEADEDGQSLTLSCAPIEDREHKLCFLYFLPILSFSFSSTNGMYCAR